MGRVILVTGGSGLAGRNLRDLVETISAPGDRYFFASSKDADLTVDGDVEALFSKVKPTHVIHLAASVGGLFKNLTHNVELFRENVRMNDLILHHSHVSGVRKVVYCLSTCIFPMEGPFPLSEADLDHGVPHPSNEGYGYSKRMLHKLAQLYNRQFGTEFVGICPCNLFGKYDNFNLKEGHVVASLIHRFYEADRSDEPFIIWGTGKPLRQFLSATDFARLLLWALDSYDGKEGGGFVIAAPPEEEEVTIAELGTMVARAINPSRPVEFDSSKSDGQMKKTASCALLTRLHPNFKCTPLEESIAEVVAWFIANYDTARR